MVRCRRSLALALLAAPLAARADPPRATLAWVRGAGADACPDGRALRTALARRAGRDPVADDAPLSLEAVVTRAGPEAPWEARLFVRDAGGALLAERRLEAATGGCAAVVDAVALALAVALDDVPAAEVAPPRPPAPAADPPAPAPPAMPAPPAPRPRRWRFAARVLGGVALGMAPAPSAFAAVRAELTPPSWPRLYAGAAWLAGATGEVPPGKVAVAVTGASLGVCPVVGRAGRLDVALCAGAFAGAMTAEGRGLASNRAALRPYVAVEAGAHARWNVSRHVDLAVGADAAVPLVRDTLAVEGVGAVYEAPAVGVRGSLGVGLHFE